MAVDLIKAAAVLEAAAAHLEAVEAEKHAAAGAERQSTIDKLASKYSEATGDEMPDSIRQKLAASDSDVVKLMQSLIEKQAGQVEALGGSASIDDDRAPMTKKEAAEDAEKRFLNWIQS